MVRQIDRLREERKFWPWVFRIAYNKLQDNLRSRRNHGSAKALIRQNQLHDFQANNGGILEDTIHAERLQKLSEVVNQLSRQHRDILRLRYYEQLPYTEIATLTRTTPQKARARFHRAKKHLKAQLKEDTQQGMSIVV
jgi:RNA polymerase sigma-70 factor (ECF subfamily)